MHLNHSNAPHLFEDRLVILGVSHLQHQIWDALPSNACMHIFNLLLRSAPASFKVLSARAARPPAPEIVRQQSCHSV